MANIDDAFRVERISLDNNTLLASGDPQPNLGPGYEAPQGSLYLRSNAGTDGELYIKFGPSDTDWQLAGQGGTATLTDVASVMVGLSSNSAISTTFTNVTWPLTIVENNINIVRHNDGANTDRIYIEETGLYFLAFSVSFDSDPGEETIEVRMLEDDTSIVPGSLRLASEDDEINDLSNSFTAELTAGTYISMQIRASGNGNLLHSSSNCVISRAAGIKGEDGVDGAVGPPGSGSTVSILEEGTLIPNTPHSNINFVGDMVTATDAGSGQVDITVSAPVFGTEFTDAENLGVTTVTTTAYQEKLKLSTPAIPAGRYRVGWSYTYNHNATGNDAKVRVQLDDSIELSAIQHEPKDAAGNFGSTGTNQKFPGGGFAIVTLTSGVHDIDIDIASSNTGVNTSIWNARLEFWRVE